MTLMMKQFENIVRKGENAGYQHFLLFPKIFSIIFKTNLIFSISFILSSSNAFNLDQSKTLLFGKELKHFINIKPFKDKRAMMALYCSTG